MDINVFIEKNILMAQRIGQGAFPLTPFPNDEFRFEPAGIVVKFEKSQKKFHVVTRWREI